VTAVAAHVKVGLAELARIPAFSIPTLFFPVLTYLFVANGVYRDLDPALAMAGVTGIAVLGVAFFQFGVGIAAERTTPWERYLRTLPISPRLRLAARLIAALPVAAVSATLVVATAIASHGVSLPPSRWIALSLALLLGGVTFGLAGIALGYWLPPRGAVPIANIVFLASAIGGGLWAGPSAAGGDIAGLVPTQRWAELLWASVEGRSWRAADVAMVALSGVIFGVAAVWGYRRDEGQQFG
jgi:ABC-2 type transport system permease protein